LNEPENFHSVTFKSTKDEITLMARQCIYNDLPDDAQFLIAIWQNVKIIVGVVGEHPHVETPYVVYVNSDGSGPSIFEQSDLNNPKLLMKNLLKYS
jgi:hypothetical protein